MVLCILILCEFSLLFPLDDWLDDGTVEVPVGVELVANEEVEVPEIESASNWPGL